MPIQTLFGPPPPPSVFERFKKAVASTREVLGTKLEEAVRGKREIDAALLEQLETMLLAADLGVTTTNELLKAVKERASTANIEGNFAAGVRAILKEELLGILNRAGSGAGDPSTAEPPVVILMVGVNGVGKTTTIGKLAHQLTQGGKQVLLCAADTFRAAANEQLEIWAGRSGTTMIRQKPGADPSAVLFDALTAAKSRNVDYVIVDTAGRLHNKSNLMSELEKMRRTATRPVPGSTHQVLLILDATPAQNAISEARTFLAATGVTGIALTMRNG